MEDFNDIIEKKGLIITPSNWITLNGEYTPDELRLIADGVENNYSRIHKVNTDGDKKRLNGRLGG